MSFCSWALPPREAWRYKTQINVIATCLPTRNPSTRLWLSVRIASRPQGVHVHSWLESRSGTDVDHQWARLPTFVSCSLSTSGPEINVCIRLQLPLSGCVKLWSWSNNVVLTNHRHTWCRRGSDHEVSRTAKLFRCFQIYEHATGSNFRSILSDDLVWGGFMQTVVHKQALMHPKMYHLYATNIQWWPV